MRRSAQPAIAPRRRASPAPERLPRRSAAERLKSLALLLADEITSRESPSAPLRAAKIAAGRLDAPRGPDLTFDRQVYSDRATLRFAEAAECSSSGRWGRQDRLGHRQGHIAIRR